MDKFISKNDYRKFLLDGYDYFICTKCGHGTFILVKTEDSIFPDIICTKCGNIYQELKENQENGRI